MTKTTFFVAPLLASTLMLLGCASKTDTPATDLDHHATGTAEAAEVTPRAGIEADRPIDELFAARCEHEIPQYACDECRYELGMVKIDPDLFDRGKGGELTTFAIGARTLVDAEELPGEVRLAEDRAVAINPPLTGVVRSIRADVGRRVAIGTVLAELDSPELRAAIGALGRATSALRLADATIARERELFEKRICSRRELEEAEAAHDAAHADERAARGTLGALGLPKESIATLSSGGEETVADLLPIRAPIAGTILERSISPGARVEPSEKLFVLGDTSILWVIATLPEARVAALSALGEGAKVRAEITVAAFPNTVFEGVLDRVEGILDPATRAGRARIVVANPDGRLRANTFARVRLLLPAPTGTALVLPREAVLDDAGASFVFVRARESYFVRRTVTLGRAHDGWIEVSGALKTGDEVVARGAFLLKSDVLREKMGAGCAD